MTVVIVPPDRSVEDARAQRSRCPAAGAPGDVQQYGSGGSGRSASATGVGVDAVAASDPKRGGVAGAFASPAPERARVDRRPAYADDRLVGALPNPFEDAPGWLQPVLLAALAFAMLLLLLAAVPARAIQPAGAATVISHRRTELALSGALVLGGVAIAALVL